MKRTIKQRDNENNEDHGDDNANRSIFHPIRKKRLSASPADNDLFDSVLAGNIELVKNALSRGGKCSIHHIKAVSEDEWLAKVPALHIAAIYAGFSPERLDIDNKLEQVSLPQREGYLTIFNLLLNSQRLDLSIEANFSFYGLSSLMPVHCAAVTNAPEAIKLLNSHNQLMMNAYEGSGLTPLLLAVLFNSKNSVDALLSLPEINVNCCHIESEKVISAVPLGATPIVLAIVCRNLGALISLINHQATSFQLPDNSIYDEEQDQSFLFQDFSDLPIVQRSHRFGAGSNIFHLLALINDTKILETVMHYLPIEKTWQLLMQRNGLTFQREDEEIYSCKTPIEIAFEHDNENFILTVGTCLFLLDDEHKNFIGVRDYIINSICRRGWKQVFDNIFKKFDEYEQQDILTSLAKQQSLVASQQNELLDMLGSDLNLSDPSKASVSFSVLESVGSQVGSVSGLTSIFQEPMPRTVPSVIEKPETLERNRP